MQQKSKAVKQKGAAVKSSGAVAERSSKIGEWDTKPEHMSKGESALAVRQESGTVHQSPACSSKFQQQSISVWSHRCKGQVL